MIFEAYSDESGTFDHRYQSIAIVSGSKDALEHLRNGLQKNLADNQVREVKFYEIKGYKSPKARSARYFINYAINDFAGIQIIRIDVITWDTYDSRHNIKGRDDITNLGIMYYNLIVHMARRWGQNQWNFYPDVNSRINWGKIAKHASLKNLFYPKYDSPTLIKLDVEESFLEFGEIKEVDSIKEPLIQLADLFAGMARFSHEEGGRCIEFLTWGDRKQYKLPNLFIEGDLRGEIRKEKGSKYQLIGILYKLCRKSKLGVSLNTKKCLWTPDCHCPINFWNYEPRGGYDKAPIIGKYSI